MIGSIYELNDVINNVVNRALALATTNTTTGAWIVTHDDVSDLISEEDYLTYFDYIADEIMGREECLDLDPADHELNINCGLAWCKNYIPLPDEDLEYGYRDFRPSPSLTHLADVGSAVVNHFAQNNSLKLSIGDFGMTDADVAYARSMANPETPLTQEYSLLQNLTLPQAPVTSLTYEELLCRSAENSVAGRQPAIDWCINGFGQTIASPHIKETYPAALRLLEKIFASENPSAHAGYAGALVFGKPTIVTSRVFGAETLNRHTIPDRNVLHAQTEMMAAQLSEALSIYNANISAARSTVYAGTDQVSNEIVALMPADIDRNIRASFERSFNHLLNHMPFSLDISWVKQQYETALQYILNDFKKAHPANSETIETNAKEIAIKACSFLGRRLGKLEDDWSCASATRDESALSVLSSKCDFTKDDLALEEFVDAAYHSVSFDMQSPVRMYTKPVEQRITPDDGCFILRKGELVSLLQEFEIDLSIPAFLSSYSYDLAKDMKQKLDAKKEVTRKNGLTSQIRTAEQKKSTQSVKNQTGKDTGDISNHGHDLI